MTSYEEMRRRVLAGTSAAPPENACVSEVVSRGPGLDGACAVFFAVRRQLPLVNDGFACSVLERMVPDAAIRMRGELDGWQWASAERVAPAESPAPAPAEDGDDPLRRAEELVAGMLATSLGTLSPAARLAWEMRSLSRQLRAIDARGGGLRAEHRDCADVRLAARELASELERSRRWALEYCLTLDTLYGEGPKGSEVS